MYPRVRLDLLGWFEQEKTRQARLGGFLGLSRTASKMRWWSRRESNPRPQVLYDQFYILSSII
jgi:hypothetical protein